ncbi:MAG TPA: hypothetical protein VIN36_03840, partial [Thiobacillus sp.]
MQVNGAGLFVTPEFRQQFTHAQPVVRQGRQLQGQRRGHQGGIELPELFQGQAAVVQDLVADAPLQGAVVEFEGL